MPIPCLVEPLKQPPYISSPEQGRYHLAHVLERQGAVAHALSRGMTVSTLPTVATFLTVSLENLPISFLVCIASSENIRRARRADHYSSPIMTW